MAYHKTISKVQKLNELYCHYITSSSLSPPIPVTFVSDFQSTGAFPWASACSFLLCCDGDWQYPLSPEYWICQPVGMRVVMMVFKDSTAPHAQ